MASASLCATDLRMHQLSRMEANRAEAVRRKLAKLDGAVLGAGYPVVLSPEQQERIAANRAEAMKRKYQAACRVSVVEAKPVFGLSTAQKMRMDANRLDALRRRQSRLDGATALTIPSPPIGWSAAEVPAKPQDLAGIVHCLPEMTLLSTCNPHPRDAHLTFVAASHSYYVDGVKTAGSVTGLIHAFCQEFNSHEIIHKCGRG